MWFTAWPLLWLHCYWAPLVLSFHLPPSCLSFSAFVLSVSLSDIFFSVSLHISSSCCCVLVIALIILLSVFVSFCCDCLLCPHSLLLFYDFLFFLSSVTHCIYCLCQIIWLSTLQSLGSPFFQHMSKHCVVYDWLTVSCNPGGVFIGSLIIYKHAVSDDLYITIYASLLNHNNSQNRQCDMFKQEIHRKLNKSVFAC